MKENERSDTENLEHITSIAVSIYSNITTLVALCPNGSIWTKNIADTDTKEKWKCVNVGKIKEKEPNT